MDEKLDVQTPVDPANPQVGQEFFVAFPHPMQIAFPPNGEKRILKITKVGTVNLTLEGGFTVQLDHLRAQPMKELTIWKGSTYKGEAFLSRKDHGREVGHNEIYRRLHWPANKPRHVTLEQIEQIRAILYPHGSD